MKHHGSLEDLKTIIRGCGFNVISDEEKPNNSVQLRTAEGAIVNWYPTTGTVTFQGDNEQQARLKDAWRDYTGQTNGGKKSAKADSLAVTIAADADNKKIFVVHGHDETSRDQLELLLRRLGLDPYVLANKSGGGMTIIEALEREIKPGGNQAKFGIVLMTPDDMGYAKKDGGESAEPRARQNVILEMGMLISALGRENVAILKKGHVEVPSDAQGIIYIPFNEHVKEAANKLIGRLRDAGFVLPPEKIDSALN